MRKHYDFEKMKGHRNPYIKLLKQPITIRLDKDTISYFKTTASKVGMPYQNLINLYLRDCVDHKKSLQFKWAPLGAGKDKFASLHHDEVFARASSIH